MAENSDIQWTNHTFNPWSGCTKVSEGCKNCYAEVNYSVLMRGIKWGPQGDRAVKAESGWKEPLKWNRDAGKAADDLAYQGRAAFTVRPRVFCASLADVFESWDGPMLDAKGDRLVVYEPNGGFLTVLPYAEEPGAHCRWMTMQDVRNRLFRLIDATPNLDWLVLTKRPENIAKMMPAYSYHACATGDCPHDSVKDCDSLAEQQCRDNLWLGVSVENQKAKSRIDLLRETPAAVRFLSIEPLLENVGTLDLRGINWVIVGGESGPGARPMDVAWARSIVEQCKAAGVACFVKQLGAVPQLEYTEATGAVFKPQFQPELLTLRLKDKKGGDIAEFPKDLRVRQYPK